MPRCRMCLQHLMIHGEYGHFILRLRQKPGKPSKIIIRRLDYFSSHTIAYEAKDQGPGVQLRVTPGWDRRPARLPGAGSPAAGDEPTVPIALSLIPASGERGYNENRMLEWGNWDDREVLLRQDRRAVRHGAPRHAVLPPVGQPENRAEHQAEARAPGPM